MSIGAFFLPPVGFVMTYDAAGNRVCADVPYDGSPGSRQELDPFPSAAQTTALAPAVYISFVATQAGGVNSGATAYPANKQVDPDLTHITGVVFDVWQGEPSDPTATKLYTGAPGTPSSVPVDWTSPALGTLFVPIQNGSNLGTTYSTLTYTVLRKDPTDPHTYFLTNLHVCVGLIATVFTPPTSAPAVSPLADVSWHQTHGLHADLYAHAVLGAAIDITNADWYMTTPRRHWVSGYDIMVSAQANPPAERGKLKLIATGLPRVNAAGRNRYLKIGGKIGDKIAPH